MTTGLARTNFSTRQLVTRQDLANRLLDYLLTKVRLTLAAGTRGSGITLGGGLSSSAPDTFRVTDPTEGVLLTGRGADHFRLAGAICGPVPFENNQDVVYQVGLRFQEVPNGVALNPRSGKPYYPALRETVGELGPPDQVIDNGDGTLTLVINTLTDPNADCTGRVARVFLVDPETASPAAFEDLPVSQQFRIVDPGSETGAEWLGNAVTTQTLLGQRVATTDPAKYRVLVEGPTWTRSRDLSADPAYAYLGTVTGSGQGTIPAQFNVSGQINPSAGGTRFQDLLGILSDAQHGQRAGGNLHPIVVPNGAAGFMSGADKRKLDQDVALLANDVVFSTIALIGGGTLHSANVTGLTGGGATALHKHDLGQQDGTLASNAAHGTRGGAGLHTVVNQSEAGFMSVQDKLALDALAADAIRKTGAVPFTADQSMGGRKLTSVANPATTGDAANKGYVDQQVSNLSGSYAAPVQTLAELAAVASSSRQDKQLRLVEDDAALWRFDAQSATGAGAGVVVPNDAPASGRWIKVQASTNDHEALSGLQGGEPGGHYHLTPPQHADLTDGGDSAAHYHSADRTRANHTGTQPFSTVSGEVSDAQHGNRNGGLLHALAAAGGAAGFLSGADKSKLDALNTAQLKFLGNSVTTLEYSNAGGTSSLRSALVVSVPAGEAPNGLLILASLDIRFEEQFTSAIDVYVDVVVSQNEVEQILPAYRNLWHVDHTFRRKWSASGSTGGSFYETAARPMVALAGLNYDPNQLVQVHFGDWIVNESNAANSSSTNNFVMVVFGW